MDGFPFGALGKGCNLYFILPEDLSEVVHIPMSAKGKGQAVRNPMDGAVMTFEEIAKVLGITRGGAWMAYQSAMRKLRRCRKAFETMRDVAALKQGR